MLSWAEQTVQQTESASEGPCWNLFSQPFLADLPSMYKPDDRLGSVPYYGDPFQV
jgi:hypothetical protein